MAWVILGPKPNAVTTARWDGFASRLVDWLRSQQAADRIYNVDRSAAFGTQRSLTRARKSAQADHQSAHIGISEQADLPA